MIDDCRHALDAHRRSIRAYLDLVFLRGLRALRGEEAWIPAPRE
jgi:hypothetical protein